MNGLKSIIPHLENLVEIVTTKVVNRDLIRTIDRTTEMIQEVPLEMILELTLEIIQQTITNLSNRVVCMNTTIINYCLNKPFFQLFL